MRLGKAMGILTVSTSQVLDNATSVKHLTPDELIAKKILEDYDLALEK